MLGLHYFISAIILMVVQLLAITIFSAVNEDFTSKYYILIAMIPAYLIGTPVIVKLIERQPADGPEKQNFSVGKVIAAFFVTFAAMWIGNIVGNILNVLLSGIAHTEATNAVSEMIMGSEVWQNLIVVVILAPVFEEFLFRKLLIDRLVKYGEGVAIALSGLLFGLYHGNVIQLVYAGLIGLVFAYVYVKSGRLIYSVILHMLINFIGSIVAPWVIEKSNFMALAQAMTQDGADINALVLENMGGIMLYFGYLLMVLGFLIAGIVLFCCNVRRLNLLPGDVQIQKGKRFKTIFLNPGMIVYTVLWIAMMVFNLLS